MQFKKKFFTIDLGSFYVAFLSLCGCCCGFIFLVAIVCISLISTAQSDSYSVSIGDVLDSSSALLIVNSPAVATATFEAHTETIIFQTGEMPLKITEKLSSSKLFSFFRTTR